MTDVAPNEVVEYFFYTRDTPHRWSSGPSIVTFEDDGSPIASLERAKELAQEKTRGKWGDEDFVKTTYGVYYG